jgi:hypothetical protein
MELTGKVIAVLPLLSGVSQRTGNPWAKQDYVIEIPGQFPRRVAFEVFGEDKIRQFNIQMGEEITVSFDINASEYQGKWYNKISAWQVVRGGAGVNGSNGVNGQQQAPVQQQAPTQQQAPVQQSLFNQTAAAPAAAAAPAPSVAPAPQPTVQDAGQAGGEADGLPF